MPGIAELPDVVKTRRHSEVATETGHYEAYSTFARTLRTWFIAYGIGGPVLIASQQWTFLALARSGKLIPVALAFLAGVSLQLVSAGFYKYAMWYLYRGEYSEAIRRRRRYRFSYWVSEAYWLELLVDLTTTACFAWATTLLLFAICYSSVPPC